MAAGMPVRLMGQLDLMAVTTGVAGAVAQARALVGAGADLVEIGVGAGVGTDRAEALVGAVVEATVGTGRAEAVVATPSSALARAGVEAGATMVRGVALAPLAGELGVGWIASSEGKESNAGSVAELATRAETARAGGVEEIWLDPGIGLGHDRSREWLVHASLDRLVALGWPVVVGPPGATVRGGNRPVDEVVAATWAMICGAHVIRAENIPAVRQAATVVTGHPGSTSPSSPPESEE